MVKFLEDLPLEERRKIAEKKEQENKPAETIQSKDAIHEYKYRVEQLIMFKVNSIPMDTFQTKCDYKVIKQKKSNLLTALVSIEDDSFTMYPEKFTEFMNLVNNLEKIKSNALFEINSKDGHISKIINYKEVVNNWEDYKFSLLQKHEYVRSPETKQALETFIAECEKSILNEQALIQELNAKTFFHLFFDKYLVTKENIYSSYKQIFRSQLFEGLKFQLGINQKILEESPEKVLVERKSVMPTDLDQKIIEERYDKEYKDKIGYKYSSYTAGCDAKILYNDTSDDINLEEVELILTEEIVNNLELIVHHKLRKLK